MAQYRLNMQIVLLMSLCLAMCNVSKFHHLLPVSIYVGSDFSGVKILFNFERIEHHRYQSDRKSNFTGILGKRHLTLVDSLINFQCY